MSGAKQPWNRPYNTGAAEGEVSEKLPIVEAKIILGNNSHLSKEHLPVAVLIPHFLNLKI
jgi:hypothetical protein